MASVAVYVHDLRASGVVRNAMAIAERLAQEWPTTLVAGYRAGLFAAVAGRGASTVTLADGGQPGNRVASALHLRRYLDDQRPSVVLSAGNYSHPTTWLATRGLSAAPARLYRISNEITRVGRLHTALRARRFAWLVRDATRIAVVGETIGTTPLLAPAIAAGRAVVVRNGIDADRVRRLAAAPTPHPWLDDEVPVIMAVGRLHPQKNLCLLVEAFARLRATRPLRLIVVGGGPAAERRKLVDLAAAHGAQADLLLPGEIDNVFPWLSRAAVFALSSRWEGSSVALLEALALGVPVVANRCAGDARMVLGDGRYGVLSDDDPAAFAASLDRQLGPGSILPAGRAADYPLSATLDAYAQLIAAALAERNGGPGRLAA